MKKKLTAVALIVALLAVAIIGGTLAYFTDTEEATNTFTVGNVDITLEEPLWVQPETVEPGVKYNKDPYVDNVGKSDAWVRMNVTLTDWAAFKAAGAAHSITDLTTIFGGADTTNWTLAGAPVEDADKDTVTYSYYFNSVVPAGTTTTRLFETVTVPSVFTNTEMEAIAGEDGKFFIDITADAIQTADAYTTPAAAFAAFDATKPNPEPTPDTHAAA